MSTHKNLKKDQNFGFDRQITFTIREQFVRNIILKFGLSNAETCVLKPNWQNILIKRITTRTIGNKSDDTIRPCPIEQILEVSPNDKSLTNPENIKGYVFLNDDYSNISQNLEFEIDIASLAEITVSGTCVFSSCKVIFEYSDVSNLSASSEYSDTEIEENSYFEAFYIFKKQQ